VSAPGVPVAELAAAVRQGDRTQIGRALTLVESRLPEHREAARALLAALAPAAGDPLRVGITGPPGAGKSTLIEALGCLLVERGARVAVLAVDPSSTLSGGSILGDKTRMTRLSLHPRAFVRPSPSGGSLGGVARHTREACQVLAAAGYGVVLVETMGVGQSETAAAGIVDVLLVVLAPGAGDELQGIKRGILELADLVVINKADGEGKAAAERARRDFSAALRILHPDVTARPRVLAASALSGEGVAALWAAIETRHGELSSGGALRERRRRQRVAWMWELVEEGLRDRLRDHPAVAALLPALEARVAGEKESPPEAAERLLRTFLQSGH
jgi:LAO/AO transport system kinase